MGKTKFQAKHVALLGILVLVVSLSVGYLSYASVLNIPQPTGPNGVPSVSTGDNFTGGVDLGTKSTNDKGEPIPLIPKSNFDGVNAQFWANSNGPAQIPDDAIVHGIADSRNGFINTAYAVVAPGPAPTPQPVYIYDDLYIKGNSTTAEPGNLLLTGQISNPDPVKPVVVNNDLNTTLGHNLQVGGDAQVFGTLTALSIGKFNIVTSPTPATVNLNTNTVGYYTYVNVSCPTGDALISCSASFAGSALHLEDIIWFTEFNNSTCGVRAKKRASDGTANWTSDTTVAAKAVCFSPNGD